MRKAGAARAEVEGKRVAPRGGAADVLARIGGAGVKGEAGSGHRGRTHKTKKRAATIASRVDRHALYELSVQAVDAEIDFVEETFRTLRGRRASLLREDFSGTANTSCEWVKRRPTNKSWSVDLDPEVLDWGRRNTVARLKPAARKRVHLMNEDVLTVKTPPMDVVLAMNFSYWLFMTREEMKRYFRSVWEHLKKDGVFFLDSYGGYESYKECVERRVVKERGPWGRKFTYIWDQHKFDPVTGAMDCRIHFGFEDGSRLRDAYTYRWRLWSLPELRELLAEAGFRKSTVYWEGWDEKTWEGNGDFQPVEHGEADAAFIVYIVAER